MKKDKQQIDKILEAYKNELMYQFIMSLDNELVGYTACRIRMITDEWK